MIDLLIGGGLVLGVLAIVTCFVGRGGSRAADGAAGDAADGARVTRRASPLWLLLTIPAALVLSLGLAFIAGLMWCGVSGCSGGGYGRISDPDPAEIIMPSVLVGLIWFCALGIVPWSLSPRVRLSTSAAVGLALGLLLFFSIVSV
ncbi:MAG: hypothetical protein QM677_03520 [Microbacterium sp.]